MSADIALIGLAVMGQNLILNMDDHGYVVCAFNRTVAKVQQFLDNEAKNTKVIGADSLEDLVAKLKKPRKIILLVMAGKPVDDFIEKLIPLLEPNDIIIDGGNSDYRDTRRRYEYLTQKNLNFIGSGVSGGEEGARHGPSLMPGGSEQAWPHVKDIFNAIAAKVDGDVPCCSWIGNDGAGHFVKMVHNGIEYGDMQLICEAYFLMKNLLNLNNDEMSAIFADWNKKELCSYLIEITSEILNFKDDKNEFLVEKIRDTAGQKGTGKWTVINGLDFGSPVTLIAEAVFCRCLSSLKSEREVSSGKLARITCFDKNKINKDEFVADIKNALYASKIVSYAQGFMLLQKAAEEFNWKLDFSKIALTWRGGCIIRSSFLSDIADAYTKNASLQNLLLDEYFKKAIDQCQVSWRKVVANAVQAGVPVPAFSSALAFYDSYSNSYLPANLLQAQRDYFGAHTYELLDKPGEFVHTNWTGTGGTTSASNYGR